MKSILLRSGHSFQLTKTKCLTVNDLYTRRFSFGKGTILFLGEKFFDLFNIFKIAEPSLKVNPSVNIIIIEHLDTVVLKIHVNRRSVIINVSLVNKWTVVKSYINVP